MTTPLVTMEPPAIRCVKQLHLSIVEYRPIYAHHLHPITEGLVRSPKHNPNHYPLPIVQDGLFRLKVLQEISENFSLSIPALTFQDQTVLPVTDALLLALSLYEIPNHQSLFRLMAPLFGELGETLYRHHPRFHFTHSTLKLQLI